MDVGWNMAAYMGVRASRELEVVSHNLATASTLGFKREILNAWRLTSPADPFGTQPEVPNYLDVRSWDFSQGSIHETGKDTDLAIQGPGFFKIQPPQGIRYTRNGNFRLSPDYRLVTPEGYPVMGKNGPITLESLDKAYSFDAEGASIWTKTWATRSWWWISPIPRTSGLGARPIWFPAPRRGKKWRPNRPACCKATLRKAMSIWWRSLSPLSTFSGVTRRT
uniref:Flagellar hook basal-body protein n=1 Tax=Desulfobacca acetoxidans TaxID=60893 RepID=A0A7C3ZBS7_9BACT